jgi:uridine phosphorylase
MPYPNFPNKHNEKALVTPEAAVAHLAVDPPLPFPDAVIICYQSKLLAHILELHETTGVERGTYRHLHWLNDTENRIAVAGGFGVGAPAAVLVLEALIFQGIRRFLSIGTAGSLQKNLAIGSIVVCDRAIRDEGTSHHYLPREKYAYASPAMTSGLVEALQAANIAHSIGTSWTIDAPYRETIAEVHHYQAESVLTVEMEAAALFAVAAYRGVEMGSLLTISDSLADLKWDPQFRSDPTRIGLETLYQVALQTLLPEAE